MTIKFGLDMGQSSLKGMGLQGAVQFASLAALLGTASVDMTISGKKKKRPMVVSHEDFGELYVGHGAHRWGVPLENFDFARLAGVTPEMRAIFYGAMTEYQRKHGPFAEPMEVIVGLPMQMLSGSDESVKKFNKQVKGWIGGEHHWQADGEPFEMVITRVDLAPQALGAVIDYAFDEAGNAISDERNLALTRECGTLWIGSNTVEAQATKRDEDTKRFNGGSAIGVRWLHNRVDPNGWRTFGEFDELLRANDEEIMEQVQPFLGAWETEIFGFVNRLWGQSWQRFHKVFIGGGGSILLRDRLASKFNGKVVFSDDPLMSIAHGLYKAALRSK